jgi:hypothetical protein
VSELFFFFLYVLFTVIRRSGTHNSSNLKVGEKGGTIFVNECGYCIFFVEPPNTVICLTDCIEKAVSQSDVEMTPLAQVTRQEVVGRNGAATKK